MNIIYNNKVGWYRVINPEKVIKPIDDHMKSFRINESGIEPAIELNFKSGLELKALRYCDYNKHVIKYALEPYPIKYMKPTDGKIHRYYIDLYMEFSSGDKFLVEIKSSGETIPPKKPRKKTEKAKMNYQRACMTYAINQAKWDAAKKFAELNNMKFITLTENELS